MLCEGQRSAVIPSPTAASVVWCGHPVNTWTAGAPPQCRHTFPHCPGLNCTPATTPLGLLATPEHRGDGKRKRKGVNIRIKSSEEQMDASCGLHPVHSAPSLQPHKGKDAANHMWRLKLHPLFIRLCVSVKAPESKSVSCLTSGGEVVCYFFFFSNPADWENGPDRRRDVHQEHQQ